MSRTKVVTQDKNCLDMPDLRKRNNKTKGETGRTTELYFADLKS